MATYKGFYKVECLRGASQTGGAKWVAMITSDPTGPEYFFGTERECWSYIDRKRSEWTVSGRELVHQGPSGFRV